MTKKMFCLSSIGTDGEAILHNGTSSNETPRPSPAVLTHIAGAGTPSSSKPASAPICTCGLELGYIPPYQIGDEEFDMVIFTRRCEIHEQGKHGDFLEELRDFKQPRLRLTMEGLKMQMRLYRAKNLEVEVKIQTPGGVK